MTTLVGSNKSLRIERQITYGGKPVFSYFVAPCKDGIIFGIMDRGIGYVHLTLFWKDGKIRTHITDATKPEGTAARYPWGQQFTPYLFVKRVERSVRRWVKPVHYHPLRKAWVLKKPLEKKVQELSQATMARASIPSEVFSRLDQPESWDWVSLRSLIGKSRIALIEDKSTVKLVFPVDPRQMIAIPVGQIEALNRMIWREYGFDKYWEYIKPKITMELRKEKITLPS